MKKHLLIIILLTGLKVTKAQLTHAWANAISSTSNDNARVTCTDSNGNVYIGGGFKNTVDFDPGPGVYNVTSQGNYDAYVAKYAPNGSLLAVYTFTNNLYSEVLSICIDNNDNLICTGGFSGTIDCDPGVGVSQEASGSGDTNIFMIKLNANGTFAWGYAMGGNAVDDYGIAVTTDSGNNVLFTGYFQGNNVDLAPGPAVATKMGGMAKQIFLLKLNAAGVYQWVIDIGGSSLSDVAQTLTTDALDNIYIGGYFSPNTDFDPGPSTYTLVNPAGSTSDAFIAKYTPSGAFVWVDGLKGNSLENVMSLKLDASGNVYATGNFQNTVDFDSGANTFNLTSTTLSDDIFLLKLDNAGNFIWAKGMGNSGNDFGTGLSIVNNNMYVTGYFVNTVDFEPGTPTVNLVSNGLADVFMANYDLNGLLINAINVGGAGNDYGRSISATSNSITVCGAYSITCDFDASVATNSFVSLGLDDGFVMRYLNQSPVQSTKENNINSITNIYPNPSNGSFIISSRSDENYIIINSVGEIIKTGIILKGENEISNLPTGMYFLQCSNQKGIKVVVN